MNQSRVTADMVEIVVANHFNWRQNLIVPNVHWGLGLEYECDMVIVRPSGYVIEVEIKVTAADLRRDRNKRKWQFINSANLYRTNQLFKLRYFAVPVELAGEINNIPEGCGFIVADVLAEDGTVNRYDGCCKIVKQSRVNKQALPISPAKWDNLQRLAAMRIWSLKEHMMAMRRK